ncbi:hypothetical protein [Streptomyces sp. NPDC058644]|uniref:hypothetical protein n=1 Tax=unclassified Streptomyces TaxID=2593676 RepID=UPI00365666CC
MTLIYAFQDSSGQWHGDPDAPLLNPADQATRGRLTYQPVPGTPEADSPFVGQTLTVLYGVTDLEPGPLAYQLDSGGSFLASWYVHTLLATPVGAARLPHPRHAHTDAPTPCVETAFTENGRHYTLTATHADNGQLTATITISTNQGEIQAELCGTLAPDDLQPLARLLNSAAHTRTNTEATAPYARANTPWTRQERQRLATRFRQQRDFGVLAAEFNRRRSEIYDELLRLELISAPGQRPTIYPAAPKPAPSPVLQERRLIHRNSHARWTDEEQRQLARRCAEGALAPELSQEFGRSEQAIESRLLQIGASGPAADEARLNAL